jgi:hypothetical protein
VLPPGSSWAMSLGSAGVDLRSGLVKGVPAVQFEIEVWLLVLTVADFSSIDAGVFSCGATVATGGNIMVGSWEFGVGGLELGVWSHELST